MKRQSLLNTISLTVCVFAAAAVGFGQNNCAKTDYECKIKYYSGQIDREPKDFEAYYSLAEAYQDNRQYQASIEPLDTYIASGSPKREYIADAYNMRAFARNKLANYEAAIRDYTRAIEMFPKSHFYYNRGRSYEAQKLYDLDIADQTRAIGMDPKYTSAYFSRGFAYMEQKNYPLAISDFTKALELDPTDAESYYNRGTIYYRQKDYRLAIKDLDKYVALPGMSNSNLSDGYINRGLAYYYLGELTTAIADFTKAIETYPAMKAAYTDRAMAYRKLGKTALAEADEQKAATLD